MGLLVSASGFIETCYFDEAAGFRDFIFCQMAKGSCGRKINGKAGPRQMPVPHRSTYWADWRLLNWARKARSSLSSNLTLRVSLTVYPSQPGTAELNWKPHGNPHVFTVDLRKPFSGSWLVFPTFQRQRLAWQQGSPAASPSSSHPQRLNIWTQVSLASIEGRTRQGGSELNGGDSGWAPTKMNSPVPFCSNSEIRVKRSSNL